MTSTDITISNNIDANAVALISTCDIPSSKSGLLITCVKANNTVKEIIQITCRHV